MSLRCMRWTWVPMFGRTYGIAGTAVTPASYCGPKLRLFSYAKTRKVPCPIRTATLSHRVNNVVPKS